MTTDEKLDLILKRWDELEIRLKKLETIVNEIRNPIVTVSVKEFERIQKLSHINDAALTPYQGT